MMPTDPEREDDGESFVDTVRKANVGTREPQRIGAVIAVIESSPDPVAEFARLVRDPKWIEQTTARDRANEAAQARKNRLTGEKLWREICPSAYQAPDWSRLAQFAKPIGRIRSWSHGWRGVYGVGRSGRGKTFALWDLVRRLLEEGREVRVLRQTDVTRALNRSPQEFISGMDGLHNVDVLAWDDWGKFETIGSRTGTLLSEMEALIDDRASNGRPMLFTSNCTSAEIIRRFGEVRGEPILRRIKESCEEVGFGWE